MGDPRQSSLATGAGMPWGPMQTGRPTDPVFEQYEQDLSKYKPDTANQVAEMQRDLALKGGGAMRQYQAQAAKMGGAGTTTADMGRRMGDIAVATDYNQRRGAADIEFAAMDMGMKQMDAINRARSMRNQLLADDYNRKSAEFNAEQQSRGGFVKGLLGTVGTIGGGIAGGIMSGGNPMGVMAGSSMGGSLAGLAGGGGGGGQLSAPGYGGMDLGTAAYQLYNGLGSAPMALPGNGSYGTGLGGQYQQMPQLDPALAALVRRGV